MSVSQSWISRLFCNTSIIMSVNLSMVNLCLFHKVEYLGYLKHHCKDYVCKPFFVKHSWYDIMEIRTCPLYIYIYICMYVCMYVCMYFENKPIQIYWKFYHKKKWKKKKSDTISDIFHVSAQNIVCRYSLELPRRLPTIYFGEEIRKIM